MRVQTADQAAPTKAAPHNYDAFISYNRQDAVQVEVLTNRLAHEAGLRVWLDRTELQPGQLWRDKIERDMQSCAAALIVRGSSGLGPVQREERGLAYAIRDARRKAGSDFLVLYLLLPNTSPPEGTWANVDMWVQFESSLDECDHFASLVAALKGEAPPSELVAELPDQPAPYRGMADFGVDDARFFNGRTRDIREIHERLPHHPFLAILGASGSGKTSLVQAGLLASLRANALPGSVTWPCQIVRPGPMPLRSLAQALTRLQPQQDVLITSDELYKRLQIAPTDLPVITQSILSSDRRLVLIVDRLEELFTLCEKDEEQRAFADALVALTQHPHQPAWIVVTMRADFYGHVARYRGLADQIVNHQIYLKPMGDEEVAEVIENPATEVGAIFEKGLASQVHNDAEVREEIALPLLQHALDLLWRKRRGRWLTWDAYHEIEGVAGALHYHADRVIEGLGPEKQEVARRLFTRLVWLEEGAGAIMAGRRVEKTLLVGQFAVPEAAESVLQGLADKRLIVLRGNSEQATAELVHDTLPLHWDKLGQWVREDQEFILWRQRLRIWLAEWLRDKHDEGALLHGEPLTEAEGWMRRRIDELNPDEQGFIKRSVKLRENDLAQKKARKRRFIAVVAAGAIGVALFALAAFWQLVETEHQRQVARVGHLVSQAELVRNQGPHLLPVSVLLAVEAMNVEGVQGLESFNLSRILRIPVKTIGRLRFGSVPVGLVEAGQTLRNGLALLPHPVIEDQLDKEWVTAVAYSPDGGQLATAGDGSVQLWRVPDGEKIVSLHHDTRVMAVAYSADGSRLATASGETVHLWRLSDGERIAPLKHDGRVMAVAFGPDSVHLAAASKKQVHVWDTNSGARVTRIKHVHDVAAIAYSPDGLFIATASSDAFVRVWEVQSGRLVVEMLYEDAFNAIGFSADGAYLTTGSDDGAQVWEISTRKQLARVKHGVGKAHANISRGVEAPPPRDVRAVAFSPNVRYLATAGTDRTARVWDWRSGLETTRIVHEKTVNGVAFSPDGRYLATASAGGSYLWEMDNGGEIARMNHEYSVTGLAFSPDGTYLATTTSGDTAVRIWHAMGIGAELARINHASSVKVLAFHPDGTSLTTITEDNQVRVWKMSVSKDLTIQV